ncbi:MAG: hypothetical protein Q9160_002129 [Pyrenula sp. 1 TL-2023]
MTSSSGETPKHVLILGSGVFGLSTALALASRPHFSSSRITIVDQFNPHESNSTEPNPSASSIDTSRIIRADYASAPYARLALAAQELWRDVSDEGWGGQGRYHQNGLLLTTDAGQEDYVRRSLDNVRYLTAEGQTEEVFGEEDVDRLMGNHGISSGTWGYLNRGSGWADAEAAMKWAISRVNRNRVEVRKESVHRLLLSEDGTSVVGAQLGDDSKISADLTVLAGGAWSASLIDLRGRVKATGQILGYLTISKEEREKFQKLPTLLNMSRGLFLMPPSGGYLKVARHAFGYENPQRLAGVLGCDEELEVSVPDTDLAVPAEGQNAIRQFLRQLFPPQSDLHGIADRPFAKTRVCWYTDTPTGDFLVDFHPEYGRSLLVATGGSGHGFKFLPVLGEKVVDRLEGCLEDDLASLWKWTEPRSRDDPWQTEDGSRGGIRGMLLEDERMKTM